VPVCEVNAFYDDTENSITFPAAILQPPFFDANASSAANYGALGAVIGHEMTHGFDDAGRLYDLHGKLSNWWTDEDAKKFQARMRLYDAQFATYTIGLPLGAHINPKLTAGENIADLGGLHIALDAYLTSRLTAMPCQDGKVTQHENLQYSIQTFFLAYAQSWREVTRARALLHNLNSNPHAPEVARTNVPVSNMDAWYKVFNISADSLLFRAQSDRVQIW